MTVNHSIQHINFSLFIFYCDMDPSKVTALSLDYYKSLIAQS